MSKCLPNWLLAGPINGIQPKHKRELFNLELSQENLFPMQAKLLTMQTRLLQSVPMPLLPSTLLRRREPCFGGKSCGDLDTPYDDKLARAMALYIRWRYKNTEEQALEGEALLARQKSQCQKLRFILVSRHRLLRSGSVCIWHKDFHPILSKKLQA